MTAENPYRDLTRDEMWQLLDDEPFRDPTSLFITPDHYVNRLMHARGVDLADLGVSRFDIQAIARDAAYGA